MQPISRRSVLTFGGLGLVSTAVGMAGLSRQWTLSALEPVIGAGHGEPAVLRSQGGRLDVRLVAARGSHQVAGRRVTTLGYNGGLPGPTLRLRSGDRLRIELINRLDEPTNLHVHGLHVSPRGNGDNVFVVVAPGDSFTYEFQLPQDHPPGVFWYHPHHHGMVADQLFGGLYGAILVEDTEPIPVTRERVMVISDITLDRSGRIVDPSPMEQIMGREGYLVTVNGQVGATLRARPGDRERWRVVNACSSRYISLRVDGQQVQLLGMDSGRLREPARVTELLLTPGNRADVVVTARRGRSVIQSMPYDRGGMMGPMMGGGMGGAGPSPRSGRPVALATFVVTGSGAPEPAPLPVRANPRDLRGAPLARRRLLTLEMGRMGMMGGGPGGMSFTIDGREFDPDRIDQRVMVGTVEEWTIRNDSPMDHPFHLHIWPMQLVETGGRPVRTPTWLDVVNVPARSQVTVRVAFDDFGGRTVYHCHILDHEDRGMMGVVRAD